MSSVANGTPHMLKSKGKKQTDRIWDMGQGQNLTHVWCIHSLDVHLHHHGIHHLRVVFVLYMQLVLFCKKNTTHKYTYAYMHMHIYICICIYAYVYLCVVFFLQNNTNCMYNTNTTRKWCIPWWWRWTSKEWMHHTWVRFWPWPMSQILSVCFFPLLFSMCGVPLATELMR